MTRRARGDGEALGRHSDLLPPGQSVLELCDLRLQLRHLGLQTLDQPLLLAAAARRCVTSMTSGRQTHGGDRSETQECRRPLDCRSRKGIGPAACLLSYGTWAAADLGTARHPVCYIPHRLLRHALIEVAWPVVPQSTHSHRQTWLTRITGRPVLAIFGPMRKNRGRWRLWVGTGLPLSSPSGRAAGGVQEIAGTFPGSETSAGASPAGLGRAITGLPALARFAPRPLVFDLADQVSTHLREGMIKVAMVGGGYEVRPSR